MVWDQVKEHLRGAIADSEYRLWIDPLTCQREDEEGIELRAPDKFFSKWIEDHYLDRIRSALAQVGAAGRRVRIAAEPLLEEGTGNAGGKDPARQMRLPGVPQVRSMVRSLHPRFTFSQFMVGRSNLLAHSACKALASGETTYGHCLFLTSTTGLGKSHLTQAVVHEVLRTAPQVPVHYLTAQQFAGEMVKAIKRREMDRFNRRFLQGCDFLLVEDVHTLVGKEKTQEELNMVLDCLLRAGKRVVLTSAVPLRKLDALDADFRSRMASGLVTTIEEPDYQTRTRIIRHKAAINDLELREELVDYLAQHLHGDVRRIESVIISLRAKSCLLAQPPDLELVKAVVAEVVGRPGALTGEAIRNFVSCQFKVSVEDLVSRSRKRSITFPRQVGMYLTRRLTEASLVDIGALYNRDHSTVLHAIRVVQREMERKASVREQVELLCAKLEQ